eukprot:6201977-Ditylum_brightwellii.AAC.1
MPEISTTQSSKTRSNSSMLDPPALNSHSTLVPNLSGNLPILMSLSLHVLYGPLSIKRINTLVEWMSDLLTLRYLSGPALNLTATFAML